MNAPSDKPGLTTAAADDLLRRALEAEGRAAEYLSQRQRVEGENLKLQATIRDLLAGHAVVVRQGAKETQVER